MCSLHMLYVTSMLLYMANSTIGRQKLLGKMQAKTPCIEKVTANIWKKILKILDSYFPNLLLE